MKSNDKARDADGKKVAGCLLWGVGRRRCHWFFAGLGSCKFPAIAVSNFFDSGCKMDNVSSFWQLGDELLGHTKISEDHKWLMVASKLAEQTRSKGECMNNLDLSKGPADFRSKDRSGFQEDNKFVSPNFNLLNSYCEVSENLSKGSLRSNIYTMNAVYQKSNVIVVNVPVNKCSINNHNIEEADNSSSSDNDNANDKRFKTLPAA
ncbi:hypothetical protein Ancab_018173 [Ancistrocladus abbreviatus]